MAGAGQDYLLDEIRHVAIHRIDFLTQEAEDAVAIARDKQGRLRQLRTVEKGGQLPVAIDVAIVVEAAGKTAAIEFIDEELDVLVGHEARLLRRRRSQARHILGIDCEFPALLGRRLARRRVQPTDDRLAHVSLENLLCARRAKNLLIENLAGIFLLLPRRRTYRTARQIGHAQ